MLYYLWVVSVFLECLQHYNAFLKFLVAFYNLHFFFLVLNFRKTFLLDVIFHSISIEMNWIMCNSHYKNSAVLSLWLPRFHNIPFFMYIFASVFKYYLSPCISYNYFYNLYTRRLLWSILTQDFIFWFTIIYGCLFLMIVRYLCNMAWSSVDHLAV